MTKEEMQAEIGRLRAADTAWRELVKAIRDALDTPFPDRSTWDNWLEIRYDRLSETAAHTRGVLHRLANSKDAAPSHEAQIIREYTEEVAARYAYRADAHASTMVGTA